MRRLQKRMKPIIKTICAATGAAVLTIGLAELVSSMIAKKTGHEVTGKIIDILKNVKIQVSREHQEETEEERQRKEDKFYNEFIEAMLSEHDESEEDDQAVFHSAIVFEDANEEAYEAGYEDGYEKGRKEAMASVETLSEASEAPEKEDQKEEEIAPEKEEKDPQKEETAPKPKRTRKKTQKSEPEISE